MFQAVICRMQRLEGHSGCVVSVDSRSPSFSHLFGVDSSSTIVTAAEDATVRVWDVKGGKCSHIIAHKDFDGDSMGPVRLSNSENVVVAAVDNVLYKFDLRNTAGAVETAISTFNISEAVDSFLKNKRPSDVDRCIGNFELIPFDHDIAFLPLDSGETLLVDFSERDSKQVLNRWQLHANVADASSVLISPKELTEFVSRDFASHAERRQALLGKQGPRMEFWSGSFDCKTQRVEFATKKNSTTFDAPTLLPVLTAGNTTATGSAGGFAKGGSFAPNGQMVNPPFVYNLKTSLAQTTVAMALGDGNIALMPVSEAGQTQLAYCTALTGHFTSAVSHLAFVGKAPASRGATDTMDSQFLVASGANSHVVIFERKSTQDAPEDPNEAEEAKDDSAAPEVNRKARRQAEKAAAQKAKKKAPSVQSVLKEAPFGMRAEDFTVRRKFVLPGGEVSNAMAALGWDKVVIADTSNVVKIFDV